MGRRLCTAVHLLHPVTHEPVILQPGDEPETEVAELITHPDAWELDAPNVDDPSPLEDAPEALMLDDPRLVQDQGAAGEPPPEPEPEPEPVPKRAAPSRRRKTADTSA